MQGTLLTKWTQLEQWAVDSSELTYSNTALLVKFPLVMTKYMTGSSFNYNRLFCLTVQRDTVHCGEEGLEVGA